MKSGIETNIFFSTINIKTTEIDKNSAPLSNNHTHTETERIDNRKLLNPSNIFITIHKNCCK